MKILDRYIFRELFSLLGILLLVFTFVISLWRIPFFSELVFLGVPVSEVLKLMGYMALPMMTLSIPPAILAAAAMTYSRLSSDGEITAMKASGQSLYKLLVPPLLLGSMALVVMFYLALFAEPWGANAFRSEAFRIISTNIGLKLKEGAFIKDFDQFVIYMEEIQPASNTLKGIMVVDYRRGKTPRAIFAREGYLLRDPEAFKITLKLKDGSIHSPSDDGRMYNLLTFSQNDLSLDINKALASTKMRLERKKKLNVIKLREKLKTLSSDQRLYYPMLVEYHEMFAAPFAVLLFALIGATVGIRNRRLKKSGGFVVSIVIAFLYYTILTVGKGLGDENVMPPLLAAWLPNIILCGYCLFSIPRVNRETSIGLVDLIVGFMKMRSQRPQGGKD